MGKVYFWQSMITFRKKNDVYLEFDGDKSDLRMLSDYFTFKVPGAEFMPTYRNRMWDGKIRLFNMWNKSLYVGLTHKLEEFCKERGYELLGLDAILTRNSLLYKML